MSMFTKQISLPHLNKGRLGGVPSPDFSRAFTNANITQEEDRPTNLLATFLALTACDNPAKSFNNPTTFPDSSLFSDSGVENNNDAQPSREDACLPDTCEDGVIASSQTANGESICISFAEVHEAAGLMTLLTPNGLSLVDLNQDGWMDIYWLGHGTADQAGPNRFFENQQGVFAERASQMGLDFEHGGRDAVWVDVDHDEDLDVFLASDFGSTLYENQAGHFTELRAPAGIHDPEAGATAVWLSGGFYLGTNNGTRFYQQQVDGTFIEQALALGLDDINEASRFAVADYDGDGDDDVYVANLVGTNRFFRNLGDGTYESIEARNGTATALGSTDASWVSLQGGDALALHVVNFENEGQLYIKNADQFENQASSLGLDNSGLSVRAVWGDFLGQGIPGVFFAKQEGQSLLFVPEWAGREQIVRHYQQTRRAVGIDLTGQTVDAKWFDYNNDGRLDLLVAMADGAFYLYENHTRALRSCNGN